MIVVTGGAGFIGSCFLRKLNSEGIEDIIVVDELDSSEKWKNLTGKRFLDYFQKDLFLELVANRKIPKPEKIIHMGACSSTTCKDSDYIIKTNYEYSKMLALWAFESKAQFIYASSAATYGNGDEGYSDDVERIERLRPLNMYGYSKHLFDLWLIRCGYLSMATGIKFFNVFGPNEYHKGDMMSIVCKKISEVQNGSIKLFKSYREEYPDGEQQRDFIYVKDAVDVMFFLLNNPKVAGIFNLGTGKARSWNDLANAMFKATGKNAQIEYVDMPEDIREKYQYFTQADIRKLKDTGCAIKFRSLEDSVADYVQHYLIGNKYM